MNLPAFYVDDIIKTALTEDINYIDISADYLLPEAQESDAQFLAKADGVLCGLDVALRVFELLDPSFTAQTFKKTATRLKKGDIIASFTEKHACF